MAALELEQPGSWDPALIECLADEADRARDGDGAEGIARGQGVEVVTLALPRGLLGLVHGDRILVHPRRDTALLLIVILHELAHILMRRMGLAHTHADVWRLTLALAMPRRLRAPTPGDLAIASGAPWWAARMRHRYLAALRGTAA